MNNPFVPSPKVPQPSVLRVGGVVPFTATDYPNALAAVVFCQGCPWRCGYCHNPHLIPSKSKQLLDWPEISQWLETRRGLLDAVVFSGGEPTAQPALLEAIAATHAQGFRIGLHTGGAYPRRLKTLLPHLDWIGFDLKASASGYVHVTGVTDSERGAFESLTLIQRSGVRFEVRTTVHGALTSPEELRAVAAILEERGITHWVLQPFRSQGCDNKALLAHADKAVVLDEALLRALRERVPQVDVRY
ncbi:MAG: anaerobic ribonucleoside-triphosphate reductase activating protein [Burkholderiales bacterium]|jgi:pyruvate formate lyase activating enzyme|nr:anaerobic ribonucleoside-triphosphate reductase activating protein [Burkholderiales bacterium]